MDTLSDRFEIEREIGRGGSARVVLANDRRLGRRVAVKLLAPELSALVGKERFTQEIRLTARLVHPNIVPLFDSGEAGDQLFYVMPFVEGETLRARLRRGPLGCDEALQVLCELAEALAYAHGQGIVHRDLKPENVFLHRGHALLGDFGIARHAEAPTSLTQAGFVVGTAAYMSPEQALGDAVDARSDLYSLGCVMYEMLAGRPPFEADNTAAMIAQQVATPPPELRVADPERGAVLSALVRRLLAKRREERPGTAAELLDLTRPLRHAEGGERTTLIDEPAAATLTPSQEACRQGRSYWARGMQGGPGSLEKLELAKAYFERARQLDPGNANAIAGLADTVHVLGYRGFAPFEEAKRQARALRLEALAIDDADGDLHASIGFAMIYWEDDFTGAELELRRAFELDPRSSNVVRCHATWLKIAGRLEEAIEQMRRAIELEPAAPALHNGLGDALMAAGRYVEAIGPLRTALRLNPQYDLALERLEIACHRAGLAEDACAARRALLAKRGEQARLEQLDDGVRRLGWAAAREADVRRELVQLLEKATLEDPFQDVVTSRQLSDRIVTSYAELGEWASAMDWVERGYHRRPGRLRRVLTDFLFDRRGLAIDPRYAPLLRTAGLEELL